MNQVNSIAFSDIHPFVRFVQELSISPGDYPVFTRPYDCRLFYVRQGKGRMYIEDEVWDLTHGDLVLWQTGVKYHMDSDKPGGMYFLGTNFDFTCGYQHRDYPIPPVRADRFDENQEMEIVHVCDIPSFDKPILLHKMYSLETPLWEMLSEFQTKKVFWRERINGQMSSILADIARELATYPGESASKNRNIDAILAYIHKHYAEDLDNASIGKIFNYHPNYINRRMRAVTGQSLHQYLISYRIQKAIDYLCTSGLPITEIVRLTGFRDLSHFSKIFKQKTGYNPSVYRRDR